MNDYYMNLSMYSIPTTDELMKSLLTDELMESLLRSENMANSDKVNKAYNEYNELSNYRKPPLGVKPFNIVAGERIKELAEAIARYTDNMLQDKYISSIKKWTEEIQELCNMVEYLKDD